MIFLDCESAGLRGAVFAAAMIGPEGEVLFDGYYRHLALSQNDWLRENVEPNLTGREYDNRIDFLSAAADAWNTAREKYGQGEYKQLAAVAHMGSPVEANFFQEMWELDLIGEFDGPYPLLDTAPLLMRAGFNPDSEKAFAKAKRLEIPEGYKEHSALSDAQLTRVVWNALL